MDADSKKTLNAVPKRIQADLIIILYLHNHSFSLDWCLSLVQQPNDLIVVVAFKLGYDRVGIQNIEILNRGVFYLTLLRR
jgi:hypothetical protein